MAARSGAQRVEKPDSPSQRGPGPAVARPAPAAKRIAGEGRSISQVAAFFAAFLLVALFYVWTRTEVVKATYELGTFQRQIEAEREYAQKLRLEILTLKAPDRLASVAVQRLDMQPPGEGQVVVVE